MKNQLTVARKGKITREIRSIAKDEGVDVNALRENVYPYGHTYPQGHRRRNPLKRLDAGSSPA